MITPLVYLLVFALVCGAIITIHDTGRAGESPWR
jgi:hypothetical protein